MYFRNRWQFSQEYAINRSMGFKDKLFPEEGLPWAFSSCAPSVYHSSSRVEKILWTVAFLYSVWPGDAIGA